MTLPGTVGGLLEVSEKLDYVGTLNEILLSVKILYARGKGRRFVRSLPIGERVFSERKNVNTQKASFLRTLAYTETSKKKRREIWGHEPSEDHQGAENTRNRGVYHSGILNDWGHAYGRMRGRLNKLKEDEEPRGIRRRTPHDSQISRGKEG